MQAKRRQNPTFTELARREQIVDATVVVIAELGLEKASFAKIAQQAGLSSTSLISYHFAGRSDLLATVLGRVQAEFADYVTARIDETSAMQTLLTFGEACVDFIGGHRAHVATLRQLLAAESRPGNDESSVAADDREKLAALLAQGQRDGEFRAFDPATMASFVMALRDDVIRRSIAEPDLDIALCKHELVAALERATKKGRS